MSSSVGYGFAAFSANHFLMSATARALSFGFRRVPPVDLDVDAPAPPFPFAPAPPVPPRRRLFGDEQWLGGRGRSRVALEKLFESADADADVDVSGIDSGRPGL